MSDNTGEQRGSVGKFRFKTECKGQALTGRPSRGNALCEGLICFVIDTKAHVVFLWRNNRWAELQAGSHTKLALPQLVVPYRFIQMLFPYVLSALINEMLL